MLPSLSAAFVLGLLCGSQVLYFPITLIGLSIVAAVASTVLERTGVLDSRYLLFLCVSFLLGVVYWVALIPSPAFDRRESPSVETIQGTFVGRVVAPVQYGPGRQTILIETETADTQAVRIRLVWREPALALLHGDRIQVSGKFHRPHGLHNPGGVDYGFSNTRQDIDVMGTVSGRDVVTLLDRGTSSLRWTLLNHIDRWRSIVRDAARHSLPQPALGMFLGMIIGERGYLDQDIQEWFMVTGTIHLLSISGSHLGLVAMVVFWLVKWSIVRLPYRVVLSLSRVMIPSRVAILCAWPVVALYALLAGAEVATVRSLIMITLAMIAMWLGYERHLRHAMAVALLGIVLHDPRAIFDISFQLSFLSILAIVYVLFLLNSPESPDAQPDKRVRIHIMRYGLNALCMSAAITIVTFPLVALYFNQVPWLGIVTNLAAVPFTGFILVPLGLCAAAWSVLTGAEALILRSGLEHSFDWMVQGLRWCAAFPGGEWHVAAPSVPAIVVFYMGVTLVIVRVAPRVVRLTGAVLAMVVLSWWCVSLRSIGDGDRWRVTFLDVGQGDSAVIELPDGKTVLIDGGARYERFDMGQRVVAPFLWNRGIRRIDHVVGTHPQLDHIGGLIWVLRHVPVGRYWGNGLNRSETFVEDLNASLQDQQLSEYRAVRGQDLLEDGPCHLKTVNPPEESAVLRVGQSHAGSVLNNDSIVLRLQCGPHSVLFAADVEVGGLSRFDADGRQAVTLLKVPHHGARSSLDREWLQQIHPAYAVVSVGSRNPYGHPVESVLQAYKDQHITLYRTDIDGAVWVTGRLSTSEFVVNSMEDVMIRPVDLPNCPWRCEQDNWQRVARQWME